MKTYYVYKHTNIFNEKCYIGITSQNPVRRWAKGVGYSKSQSKFYNAILKYGWDNFTHEILFEGLSFEDALNKEVELIILFDSYENGYNTSLGGKGNPGHSVSLDARKSMSIAHKGQVSWTKGKSLTEEHKQKLSEARKGKATGERPAEVKEKISKSLKGKRKSAEARAKMSIAKKGIEPWNKGKVGLKGIPKTEDTKLKIAAANGKTVAACNKITGEIYKEFLSVTKACEYIRANTEFKKANRNTLSRLLNNNQENKVLYGYLWKYV